MWPSFTLSGTQEPLLMACRKQHHHTHHRWVVHSMQVGRPGCSLLLHSNN